MKHSKRWSASRLAVAGTTLAIGLAPVPSHAFADVVRTIPGVSAIVRAVNPAQAGCNDYAKAESFGSATAAVQNPCDIRIFANQPITNAKLKVSFNGTDVTALGTITTAERHDSLATAAGKVDRRDASTVSNAVLGQLPGANTVIWTPVAALADGSYDVFFSADGIDTALDVVPGFNHKPRCDGTLSPGCIYYSFTVASTPVNPTISNLDPASPPTNLDYTVKGTAEPLSSITVKQGSNVIGKGRTNSLGEYEVDAPLLHGANVVNVTAVSAPATTKELARAKANEGVCDICPSKNISSSFTATVVDAAGSPPSLHLTTQDKALQQPDQDNAPDPLMTQNVVTGTARDNAGVVGYKVKVTDAQGNELPSSAWTVTSKLGPYSSFTITFGDVNPGPLDVIVQAKDEFGDLSPASQGTVSIIATTGTKA
ncbi:MAG: hypothetical protein NVSMB57_00190 [Actinomycetota bacterium]